VCAAAGRVNPTVCAAAESTQTMCAAAESTQTVCAAAESDERKIKRGRPKGPVAESMQTVCAVVESHERKFRKGRPKGHGRCGRCEGCLRDCGQCIDCKVRNSSFLFVLFVFIVCGDGGNTFTPERYRLELNSAHTFTWRQGPTTHILLQRDGRCGRGNGCLWECGYCRLVVLLLLLLLQLLLLLLLQIVLLLQGEQFVIIVSRRAYYYSRRIYRGVFSDCDDPHPYYAW